jgi:hypothetical protein
MALIVKFEKDTREIKSIHPTKVVCKYLVAETGDQKVIQLNTYGSNDREFPGKLSQTLQLDEKAAIELLQIL